MSRHWWGGKKKSEAGYQPTGDTVSWDIALSQAITALDHSAELAIQTKSSSGMREVAVGWLAVASTLESTAGDEESDLSSQEADGEYPRVGFLGAPMQKEDHCEDDDEEEEIEVAEGFNRSKTFRVKRRR